MTDERSIPRSSLSVLLLLSVREKTGRPTNLLFGLFRVIVGWTNNENDPVMKVRMVRYDWLIISVASTSREPSFWSSDSSARLFGYP